MKINDHSFTSDMGNSYLTIPKYPDSEYDVIAEKMVRYDKPYFLADVSEVNINGEEMYKYDLGSFVALDQINMKMKKSEAISLLKNLLVPLTICKDWLIDSYSMVFDSRFIMVNENNYDIKYIYVFDKANKSTDQEILEFFTDIVRNIDIINDPVLLNDLMRYVLRGSFSISGLLEIVERNSDNNIASNSKPRVSAPEPAVKNTPSVKSQSAPASLVKPSVPAEDIGKKKNIEEPKKESNEINPFGTDSSSANPFGEVKRPASSGGMNFLNKFMKKDKPADKPEKPSKKDKKKDNKKDNKNIFMANGLPFNSNNISADYSEETQIIGACDSDETELTETGDAYLELVGRNGPLNPPQVIDIVLNNGEMSIGRKSENGSNDFDFPVDFKKISRQHAKICLIDQNYYICDLNNRNSTFVNDKAISKSTPVPLNEGDKIIFGDKDYIYEFRRR